MNFGTIHRIVALITSVGFVETTSAQAQTQGIGFWHFSQGFVTGVAGASAAIPMEFRS
jgi:hypothetical protein